MVQNTRIFQAQNSSNDKALKIMTIWTTDFPAVSKDRLHHLKQVGIQNAVLQCLQHNRGHSNCNNNCNNITQNIKIISTENMISNDNNKYSIYVYPVYSLVKMGFYTFWCWKFIMTIYCFGLTIQRVEKLYFIFLHEKQTIMRWFLYRGAFIGKSHPDDVLECWHASNFRCEGYLLV